MSRLADQERFYRTLQRLEQWIGAARKLGDPMSFTDLPDRGVYFFFEPGETRSDTGRGPRVVRIGTHALKAGGRATLRQRLRSHRGTRSGSGNHRGSIFRSLVGQALLARDANTGCVSWGEKGNLSKAAVSLGQSRDVLARAEAPVEALVTRHLGRTTFLWIEINDHPGPESLRGFIERNAIALLSNYHRPVIDPPSSQWLGRFSDRDLVSNSGLWNQRHIAEAHDPGFLDTFDALVNSGEKSWQPPPSSSR